MRPSVPICTALLLAGVGNPAVRVEEIPPRYQEVIQKGLDYVAKQQQRDGHWEGNGGGYPTTITSLCAMTLLMEGSTLREGKYADHIRKAVDWLMERSQRNGLL